MATSFGVEVELGVAAARLMAAMKDSATLFPKIAPDFISSIENVEGEEGVVGHIRLVKPGKLAPEGAYVKEKLLSLDPDTLSIVTTEVEGGHLMMGFTKWQTTMKTVPLGEEKVKMVISFEYEGGGDAAHQSVEMAKDGAQKLFKGLEAYLVSSGAYL